MDPSEVANWYHSSVPSHQPLPFQWCTHGGPLLRTTILKLVFPIQHQSQLSLLMKTTHSTVDTSAMYSHAASNRTTLAVGHVDIQVKGKVVFTRCSK